MNTFGAVVESLAAGNALSTAESHAAVASMLDGEVSESAAAAFLTALRTKGETADELEGAVAAVRERMTRWESGTNRDSLLDTCGTGGDCAHTVNLSTAAAIVVASCGVPVVKHGNKAATSRSRLGRSVRTGRCDRPGSLPSRVAACSGAQDRLSVRAGFTQGWSGSRPVRYRSLFPTVFNLVGPLCNPASPALQLIGVPGALQADLLAQALARQAHIRRAVVVTGSDGLDEVTLDGATQVQIMEQGHVRSEVWFPEHFGLARSSIAAIKVRDALESAEKLTRTFEGEKGPVRDYVLANSAAALWVAGTPSLREATALAASAIDSGAASALMERWRQLAPSQT